MGWTKVRLHCKICGNATPDAEKDSPIHKICPSCLLEYSPALFIGEGYTIRECQVNGKTAPQGASPAGITVH